MHRGVRRKPIFEDEMDHQVLLQIIKTSLSKYNCWLHAYCLMTNHVHLLLETGDIEIGKFMKYMSECYAIYYVSASKHGVVTASFIPDIL